MDQESLLSAVLATAVKGAHFQTCWRNTADAEAAFEILQNMLTESQQEILTAYLAARQELALALMAAAYEFGKDQGEKARLN